MIRLVAFLITVTTLHLAMAQVPQVPNRLQIGSLQLSIHKNVKSKIQEDVNRLHRSKSFFQGYVNQANVYFPLIEKIFGEEGLPTEFKYLIIQESGFKSDAVSSSKAVGYWQFKAGTAREVGVKVAQGIDERKNIEASTRGAAKYLIRMNKKLDNWAYSLLAYNRGPGGVMKYVNQKNVGAPQMVINKNTHWYVLKFLAHMVAFRDYVGKETPKTTLVIDTQVSGKTVKHIIKKHHADYNAALAYNKWIAPSKRIPSDKTYAVIVPVPFTGKANVIDEAPIAVVPESGNVETKEQVNRTFTTARKIKPGVDVAKNNRKKVNGIPVITAKKGDNSSGLAAVGGITRKKFLKYNEIKSFEELVPGENYFLKHKKRQANASFHTVKKGETVWSISQEYGITQWAIRYKNRMQQHERLEVGRVLWLKNIRPESSVVAYKEPKSVIEIGDEVIEELNDEPVITKEEPKPDESSTSKQQGNKNEATAIELYAPLIHKVEAGETLYAISKKHQLTVEQIKTWNNLETNEVSVGQELRLEPLEVKKQTISNLRVHVVKQGQTLYSISKLYEVTSDEIKKWNNLESNNLEISQRLLIKK